MSNTAILNPKETEEGGKKKSRKRLKHICSQIRSQMEFYFSDANLSKDGFVKQMIDNAEDRYVLLETFLRFNKIRAITSEVELLSKALSSSTALEVSSDGLKVRRKTPYTEPQDVDERTIYVECLPRGVDHDWLRQTFEEYGKVVYISLPCYRSTGDAKGFAFIEFATIEEAEKACQALQHPGETVTGRFPKDNKQLKHMQKQAAMIPGLDNFADTAEAEHPAEAAATHKKAKRRRRDTSESSSDEAVPAKQPCRDADPSQSEDLPTPSKHPKQSSSSSADADVSDGQTTEKKQNRKRKLDAEEECDDAKKSHQETSDSNQCSDKENVQITDKKAKDKSASKTKTSDTSTVAKSEAKLVNESEEESVSATGSHDANTRVKTEDSEEGSLLKRRKRSNESESEAKEAKRVRINEEVQVKVGSPEQKKRNRRHVKKEHIRPKEKPYLKVIPKLKWMELKHDYLAKQKSSMQELKKNLEINRKVKHARENKKEKAKQKTMQFTPNVIVKVTCANTSSRKVITEMASLVADVAYVDMLEADTEGHIRCSDADSAARLSAAAQKGLTYQLIQGEEEKQYWDKIIADRERKLNSKTRSKKRGSQKLLQRVEKSNLDVMQKKHVYFDD